MTTAPATTNPGNLPSAGAAPPSPGGASATAPTRPAGSLDRGIDELLADLNSQVTTPETAQGAAPAPAPEPASPAIRAIPRAAKVIPGDPLPERPITAEDALDASIDRAVQEAAARLPTQPPAQSPRESPPAGAGATRAASPAPTAEKPAVAPAVAAATNVADLDSALASAPVAMEAPAPIRGPAAAMPPIAVAAGVIIRGGDESPTGVLVDKSKPAADDAAARPAAKAKQEAAARQAAQATVSPEATRTAKAAELAASKALADSRAATAIPIQPTGRLWNMLAFLGAPLLRFSPNARDLLGWFALITLFQALVVWLLVFTAR